MVTAPRPSSWTSTSTLPPAGTSARACPRSPTAPARSSCRCRPESAAGSRTVPSAPVVTVRSPKLIATWVPAGAGAAPSGSSTRPRIGAVCLGGAMGTAATTSARFGVVVFSCPRNVAMTGLKGCAASSVKSPPRTPARWNVARSKRGMPRKRTRRWPRRSSGGRARRRVGAPVLDTESPVMRVSAPIGRPLRPRFGPATVPCGRNLTSGRAVVESWNSRTLVQPKPPRFAIGRPTSSDSSTLRNVRTAS